MNEQGSLAKKLATFGIAALCFGYFASYVPYSMMTKMITKGLCLGLDGKGLTGFQIQPIAVLGSFVAMYTFISLKGWWKHCTHSKIFGISFPRPQWFTFLSGICTSGQIITTTLAYTFDGISIVFAMLLMRGGVLMMAPIIDLIVKKRRRHIYWPSWIAAVLALCALLVGYSSKAGTALTVIATIDILLYLTGYFFRLYIMSSRAKSADAAERKRYFAEEQLVANPLLFFALLIVGLFGMGNGTGTITGQIWSGFSQIPFQGFFIYIFLLGVFSYGTGLFGSLIYLDKRENTFTVPANRAASVIAGVVATYLLAIFYGQRYPGTHELVGAAIIIGAIAFLTYRQVVEKRAKTAQETLRRCSGQAQATPATQTT
ncbi:MAG: hypothetical protein ABH871_00655 [Pseudomonadota bacterium]